MIFSKLDQLRLWYVLPARYGCYPVWDQSLVRPRR